jgi:uncharacterized protein (TIGR04255 family)
MNIARHEVVSETTMGRKYSKSPIIEAVCEFRFEPGEWNGTIFGLVWEEVRIPFPKRQDVQQFDFQVVPMPQGAQQRVFQQPGTKYLREDEKLSMLVGPAVMNVSHLAPYSSWGEFKPLISLAFRAYVTKAEPKSLRRIGLRYINKVELPGEKVELEDYLQFHPFLGPTLPEDHASFIVGVEFPYEQNRDVLRLQLASVPPEKEAHLALMLDLDYFTLVPNSVPLAEDQVSRWLELAHSRVEEVFEACIKDSLRARFG